VQERDRRWNCSRPPADPPGVLAPGAPCQHGLTFDRRVVDASCRGKTTPMTTAEIRARWPRLDGPCPLGCGFSGIAYASYVHYLYGDW
jgi:hypothetical protein